MGFRVTDKSEYFINAMLSMKDRHEGCIHQHVEVMRVVMVPKQIHVMGVNRRECKQNSEKSNKDSPL
jgi:hypothetical protein